MDDLERQLDLECHLKDALTRKQAPDWFEAKVLAAAARETSAPAGFWQRLMAGARLRWASAVLASAAVLASGLAWQHERAVRERTEGEAAKAQLQLALKVTRVKLRKIGQKLDQMERN